MPSNPPSGTLDFPDAMPELRGETVYLRELTEDDVPAWFERASDPASSALSGDPIPQSAAMGVQWLQRHRERFREQTGIRWVIVPEGSTESVGSIGLVITSKAQRVAELGFVVGRAHWGKGIGTSATRLVIHYGFHELGLAQIRAELLKSNLASKRVLEKQGFSVERAIPGDPQSGDDSEDCWLYVLENPSSPPSPSHP
jgi:[ribosomal protein S5]-alanine N-acetyltransferase